MLDENIEQIEKAREYTLDWANKKIEQHITYMLGTIGLIFTAMNFMENNVILSENWNLPILLVLMSASFTIFNGCKLVHWSVMHQFIMIRQPTKFNFTTKDKEKYLGNYKVAFIDAAKKVILNEPPKKNKDGTTNWDSKIRLGIAKRIIGFTILLKFILVPLGWWFVSLVLKLLLH